MNVIAVKQTISVLDGTQELGRQIKSDRNLEKLVIASLHDEPVKIVVDRIYTFALEVWNSEEEAREFMTKKHPMLDDRTPFEASMTDLGARQVEQVLGRLMFGSAA